MVKKKFEKKNSMIIYIFMLTNSNFIVNLVSFSFFSLSLTFCRLTIIVFFFSCLFCASSPFHLIELLLKIWILISLSLILSYCSLRVYVKMVSFKYVFVNFFFLHQCFVLFCYFFFSLISMCKYESCVISNRKSLYMENTCSKYQRV